MLYSGAGDGVYRTAEPLADGESERVLESDRAYRVEQFPAIDGLFAAATEDVFHSLDGERWRPLGVPADGVRSVGASPDGERLYAGTFPEHVYVLEDFDPDGGAVGSGDDPVASEDPTTANVDPTPSDGDLSATDGDLSASGDGPTASDWRELESFREQPDREAWHTPRHDDAAIVRDVRTHPDAPERLVVGVEVGGVHVGEDRGATWTPRNDGMHDDVHHLQLVDAETLLVATGDGCYRSTDAGRSWTDLAPDGDCRYFREARSIDGDVYAGAASGPSPTWPGGTDAELLVGRDGGPLEPVDSPRPDEVAIAWTVVDGTVLAATNEGTLLAEGEDGAFSVLGDVPVSEETRGRYLPLAWAPTL